MADAPNNFKGIGVGKVEIGFYPTMFVPADNRGGTRPPIRTLLPYARCVVGGKTAEVMLPVMNGDKDEPLPSYLMPDAEQLRPLLTDALQRHIATLSGWVYTYVPY